MVVGVLCRCRPRLPRWLCLLIHIITRRALGQILGHLCYKIRGECGWQINPMTNCLIGLGFGFSFGRGRFTVEDQRYRSSTILIMMIFAAQSQRESPRLRGRRANRRIHGNHLAGRCF